MQLKAEKSSLEEKVDGFAARLITDSPLII
jgi:hypothetical protein